MVNAPAMVLLRGAPWPAISAITTVALAIGTTGVALAHQDVGPNLLAAACGLLAAAAAFALDEPASAIVDVTPTRPAHRAGIRAATLAVPGAAGILLVTASSLRSAGPSVAGMTLAVLGNVLLGFAGAAIGRRHTGEPGPAAATAITITLVVLPLLGPIARRITTFPTTSTPPGAISADTWWTVASTASTLTTAISLYQEELRGIIRQVRARPQIRR